MGLRLLIVEGNMREAREAHKAAYGLTSSESYAEVLREIVPEAAFDICFPADHGANLPDSGGLEGYDGVAITGSSLNLYEGGEEVSRQIELARAIYRSKVPFFGSCWGIQVAATAAGGEVKRNPKGREIGIARKITRTEAGRTHPLLAGREEAFDAPCVHLDHVAVLPGDVTVLACNRYAAMQAAEIRHEGGTFWGVQYHPEFSLRELGVIIERRIAMFVREGFFADEAMGRAYCASLFALHDDPARSDLAFVHGIEPEILDPVLRTTELRNWLDHRVKPEASRRSRA